MYDINLIRSHIVPYQHKKVVFSVISFSVLAYVLTLLAMVFLSVANSRMIDVYAGEVEKLQSDLSVLYPDSPSREELSEMIDRLQPELAEIGGLIDTRSEFAPMWEAVASSVPDSVWLTRVRVSDSGSPPAAAKRRGKAGKQFKGIVIEGMALAGEDGGGGAVIPAFAAVLQSDATLGPKISEVKFVETGRSRRGGQNLIGFEITCAFP